MVQKENPGIPVISDCTAVEYDGIILENSETKLLHK